MSEVSTWNAVDNSNTAAPPDGFPEGMQPSAVNDAARMMMGALRREHDRISAQIGSVAGTINTTNITAVTVNTTGAITASGPITGSAINSTGNGSIAGTLTAGVLSTPGNVFAHGLITSGDASVAGTVYCNNSIMLSANAPNTGYNYFYDNSQNVCFRSGSGNSFYMQNHHYFVNQAGNATFFDHNGADFNVFTGNGYKYGGGTWADLSDLRTKRNVQDYKSGLAELLGLRPITYQRNGFDGVPDDGRTFIGLVADEVQHVMPELVGKTVINRNREPLTEERDEVEVLTLDATGVIYALVNAVQELTQQVNELKREKADV